jgi:hypothetical protein
LYLWIFDAGGVRPRSNSAAKQVHAFPVRSNPKEILHYGYPFIHHHRHDVSSIAAHLKGASL